MARTDSPDGTPPEELDVIAAALARLRGRGRGPGHFGAGGFGPGGPGHFGPGGPGRAGLHGRGGEAGSGDHERGHHGPGWGPSGVRMAGPARLRLLEALATSSHPLSVSEVAEAVGVDQPRASRLIQQAVDLGLVRREADPDDARRTRVALTDDGEKLARGFRGQRREHLAQALADFTPQERAELARLLTKMAAAWPQL